MIKEPAARPHGQVMKAVFFFPALFAGRLFPAGVLFFRPGRFCKFISCTLHFSEFWCIIYKSLCAAPFRRAATVHRACARRKDDMFATASRHIIPPGVFYLFVSTRETHGDRLPFFPGGRRCMSEEKKNLAPHGKQGQKRPFTKRPGKTNQPAATAEGGAAAPKKATTRPEQKKRPATAQPHKPQQAAKTAQKERPQAPAKPPRAPRKGNKRPPAVKEERAERLSPSIVNQQKNKSGQSKRGKAPVKKPSGKLRIIPLGGLMEIGKNMTAIEYENDIIVVDCGFAFPDEEMLGVDYVIPDITYLEKNRDRVRGILITHGHEDHIGAIPYVLRAINPPIYSTRLALGIIRNKLAEHKLPHTPRLLTVEAGDMIQLGCFVAEFIHVNHSIADACAIAIRTPLGVIYHSGDFKLDVTPIDGNMMDLVRIGTLGNEGVLLMLGESTNAERPGFSPSERRVGGSLEQIFRENVDQRLVIATFSSNVHRVQQIINCSLKFGRRVAVLGRSMENVIGAAKELGYMDLPEGTLVDIGELRRFKPGQITLVTTGSQGEPMSALYRMAFGSHDRIKLTPSDTVVLSSSAIPGNELLVDRIINALIANGIRVVSDATTANVHASGHACAEELKLLHALVRPKYFMPIHGEMRHLHAHKQIAEYMGMAPDHIFVGEIGRVLEIDADGARWNGSVPSGRVLVDGAGVGDVGAIVLRDRRHLSQDGLIVVVATVALREKTLLSGPDIVSRGFVYVRESEEMMEQARKLAQTSLQAALQRGCADWTELKNGLRDDLSKFFFQKTKRSPMILPIVMDV